MYGIDYKRMLAAGSFLLSRVYLCGYTIALLVVLCSPPANSGPAVVPAAAPDFSDPLGDARKVFDENRAETQLDAPGRTSPVALPLSGQTFSILGSDDTQGLDQPDTDDLARTVRAELTGNAGTNDETGGAGLATGGTGAPGNPSAADLVRALVNSAPGSSRGGGGATGGQQNASSGGEQSVIGSVIDATLINLITAVLNPKFNAEGLVTFSIAGFGEFALLLLQESQGIFIVDLDSGTALKIAESSIDLNSRSAARQRQATGQESGRKSNALQRLLEILERNVVPVVTSPITLATVVLFTMIWVIWRISARE